MKTCKYCLVGITSVKEHTCSLRKENRRLVRNKKSNRYSKKHTFRRLRKGIIRNSKRKCSEDCLITAFDLWKITKKQKMLCPISGIKLTNDNISVDHIIPLSKGGNHSIENIRMVTKNVNFARLNLTDEEFIDMCKHVSEYNS